MKLSVAGVANVAKNTQRNMSRTDNYSCPHIFGGGGGGGVPMVSIGTVVSLPNPLLLAVFSQGKANKSSRCIPHLYKLMSVQV